MVFTFSTRQAHAAFPRMVLHLHEDDLSVKTSLPSKFNLLDFIPYVVQDA